MSNGTIIPSKCFLRSLPWRRRKDDYSRTRYLSCPHIEPRRCTLYAGALGCSLRWPNDRKNNRGDDPRRSPTTCRGSTVPHLSAWATKRKSRMRADHLPNWLLSSRQFGISVLGLWVNAKGDPVGVKPGLVLGRTTAQCQIKFKAGRKSFFIFHHLFCSSILIQKLCTQVPEPSGPKQSEQSRILSGEFSLQIGICQLAEGKT